MERRKFIKTSIASGLATMFASKELYGGSISKIQEVRVGIIGLDTSHSSEFAHLLNKGNEPRYANYRVTIAYPYGSRDIKECIDRIPVYQKEFEEIGIEIAPTIDDLINKCDVVLLETCDGRPHLEQAIPVIRSGKRMFIDKPVAGSLVDAIAILGIADHYNVPVFSASSLRFMSKVKEVTQGKIGDVIGADMYSPASIEKTHPDLYWYGIHGIEPLFAVMGTGCRSVSRTHTTDADVCVGVWNDDRIGTFRGTRKGESRFGGYAYGTKGNSILGPFESYKPLMDEIIHFFKTGEVPVKPEETIEIFAFMDAADSSKLNNGKSINIKEVIEKAKKKAQKIIAANCPKLKTDK